MRASPFSLLLIALLVVGGVYGYVSALRNANPYRMQAGDPTVSAQERQNAKAWTPSLVWLPSYLVCTIPERDFRAELPTGDVIEAHVVGYGHENRNGAGYSFSSTTKRSRYRLMSIAVGAGIGVLLAAVIGLATGMVTIRRKPDEKPQASR